MRQDSRSEYARRMHRVLEHIDAHLDQALDLDALASVAHFSPFHFHRVFAAWMGETLGDYVRRRRLEIGALRLATQPNSTVLQVALAVGFNSGEAFTRAFRARFDRSPTEWRREQSKNRQEYSNVGQDGVGGSSHSPASLQRSNEARMQSKTLGAVRLIERAPAHVAYLRYVGPYGEPVSRFWQQQVYPWMVTNDLLGHVRYGISHDDPAIAHSDTLRYDACVEVPTTFSGSGAYHTTTIPGGRYAIAPFTGTVPDFPVAWQELFRDWLPESGMQLDSRPFFEH